MFVGIEFVGAGWEPDPAEALRVVNAIRERGVLISATGCFCNTLKIRPPLVIGGVDVDWFVEELAGVLGSG